MADSDVYCPQCLYHPFQFCWSSWNFDGWLVTTKNDQGAMILWMAKGSSSHIHFQHVSTKKRASSITDGRGRTIWLFETRHNKPSHNGDSASDRAGHALYANRGHLQSGKPSVYGRFAIDGIGLSTVWGHLPKGTL